MSRREQRIAAGVTSGRQWRKYRKANGLSTPKKIRRSTYVSRMAARRAAVAKKLAEQRARAQAGSRR